MWFVLDIVEGLVGEELVVGMRWQRKCVVVWFGCVGMFVGGMGMFVVVVRGSLLKVWQIDGGQLSIVVGREILMEYF